MEGTYKRMSSTSYWWIIRRDDTAYTELRCDFIERLINNDLSSAPDFTVKIHQTRFQLGFAPDPHCFWVPPDRRANKKKIMTGGLLCARL